MTDSKPETPEEQTARLKRFVLDFCDGRVFSTVHCEPRDAPMVFMPLALMSPEQIKELQGANVGLIYEHIDKAGPRSINGMPCFFSFSTLSREEWDRVRVAIQAELERREAVQV
jgi:hypothetical protein